MKTEILTATRALNELKLLDKRISKKIQQSCFVSTMVGKNVEDIYCKAKEDLQSVNDLIDRRESIKAALMRSNSITTIRILGKEMTVAEAIERKSSIKYLEYLLAELKNQRRQVMNTIEDANERAQDKLDRILESTFGKDLKARPSEIADVSEAFWKTNKMEIHDVVNISDKIDELDEYIDNFNNEVDLCLSEANARTEIEVNI